jgi:hypothetical protein
VRESLLCDVLLHIGRLNSVFGNALQNATQLFIDRIPQITKYCVMRECENILRGYLYDGDLVFVILKGIYGFKFPQRFLEISSRDITSFLSFTKLKHPQSPTFGIDALSYCICMAKCLASSQAF